MAEGQLRALPRTRRLQGRRRATPRRAGASTRAGGQPSPSSPRRPSDGVGETAAGAARRASWRLLVVCFRMRAVSADSASADALRLLAAAEAPPSHSQRIKASWFTSPPLDCCRRRLTSDRRRARTGRCRPRC